MTATLIREDGREEDVFSLVGPKRYDMPWKELEGKGWIASVNCSEIRVELTEAERERYEVSGPRQQMRLASMNSAKYGVIQELLKRHSTEQVLIIGQYIEQLKQISDVLQVPLIYGEISQERREELFEKFRNGKIRVLIVSKVANFAVDLPDAAVAIQISGSFGSRQEEAQRLGRILRPKANRNEAFFTRLFQITPKSRITR